MKLKRLLNYSLYFALSIFALTFTIASPIMIEIGESVSQNISNMGLLMTLLSSGFVAGSLLTSLFTRFMPKSYILNISIIFQALFLIIFPLSHSFILMLIVYFTIGMSGGFIETTISLMLPEINKGQAGYYLNISQVFFGIGAFAGPYISSIVVRIGLNWKLSYYFLAFLSFISFLIFSILRVKCKSLITISDFNSSNTNKSNHDKKIKISALTIKLLLLFSFTMLMYVASEDGLNAWIPTFFRLERGFSAYQASQILSFYWLAIAAGRLFIGLMAKKINLMKITIIISIFGFLSTFAGIMVENKYLNLIFFMLAGLFYSGIWPNIVALSMQYFKNDKRRDSFVSIIIAVGGIGALISPWMIGSIFKISSLFIGLLVCVLFIFIEVILIIILSRYKVKN
ncbi:MAG: MFS transporter [Actinobacteria bacterium]|nr:MFS transporter [Actinomycetota bacterium]